MPEDRVETVSDKLVEYSTELANNLKRVSYGEVGEYFDQNSVMTMDRTNFLEILSEDDYYVPKYQRLYSWEHENVEEFWEAVSRILELEYVKEEDSGSDTPVVGIADVFFGNFFLAEKENRDRMEVIDGQQRITTGMIFLSLIRDELLEYNTENLELSQAKQQGVRQIDNIVLSSPDDQRERRGGIIYSNEDNDDLFFALVSRDSAKAQWLSDLESFDGRRTNVTAGDLAERLEVSDHLDEDESKYIYHPDSNEKMLSAYTFYRSKIRDSVKGLDDEESIRTLINLKNFLLRSFTVGKVYIYSGSSPKLRMGIFQAINDRGKPLSKTDKIRARIANLFSETEYEKEYTEKWESIVDKFGTDDSEIQKFLKVYLTAYEDDLKTMSTASNRMMEAFALRDRDSYELTPRLEEIEDAREFLDDLAKHVDPYLDLVNPSDREMDLTAENSEKFERMIQRLNSLGTRQWRPLVLKAYERSGNENEESLIDLIDTVEKIFLRLAVSELRANNFEETFPEVSHKLNGENLDKISDILIDKAESDASALFGDTFGDILVESRGVRDNHGKLLLAKLSEDGFETESDGSIANQDLDISNADIEHVLPKTLVRESGNSDKFIWLESFFSSVEIPEYRLEELERHGRDDPLHEEIEQNFVRDLANMILLKDKDNRSIGNKPFSLKIEQYHDDELFGAVPVNDFFTTDNEDFPESKFQDIASNEYFWDRFWDVSSFEARRNNLFEGVLDLLELKEAEFKGVKEDLEQKNREEIQNRKQRLEVEI